MTTQRIVKNNGNSFQINNETSKLLLGFNNRYETDVLANNSGYDPIILPAGTVMGRVASTGKIVPIEKGASDGSQYPCGILVEDLEIDGGDEISTSIVQSGDINENLVSFYYPATSLTSVIVNRTVRDHLTNLGIKIVACDELSDYDNEII